MGNSKSRKVVTMEEYIVRDEVVRELERRERAGDEIFSIRAMKHYIKTRLAVDVAPVQHGYWKLTISSLYRDSLYKRHELGIYIIANCSKCGMGHPNSYVVSSKIVYAPENADEDFCFDRKEEENKALQEFQGRHYQFARYCPNCGAKMDLRE